MIYYVKAEGVDWDDQPIRIDDQIDIPEDRIKRVRKQFGIKRQKAEKLIIETMITFRHGLRSVKINDFHV